MDGIEKIKENEFKQQAATNLNTYIKFLNESCKIPFHMCMDKESKTLKWKDLISPEKLKLIQVDKNT